MGDSIRLRLTQEEVAALAEGSAVESVTQFAGEALTSIVEPVELRFEAHYAVGHITVMVPQHLVKAWAATDEEGLYQDQSVPGGSLQISVEKDFACLHKPESPENAGTFPNPGAKK